jgi:hypothetical protein
VRRNGPDLLCTWACSALRFSQGQQTPYIDQDPFPESVRDARLPIPIGLGGFGSRFLTRRFLVLAVRSALRLLARTTTLRFFGSVPVASGVEVSGEFAATSTAAGAAGAALATGLSTAAGPGGCISPDWPITYRPSTLANDGDGD